MTKSSMVCAGIDTGKRKLDVALHGRAERLQVDNAGDGHTRLLRWLRQHRVKRVGIEASGGYEAGVVAWLRGNRFVVIVLQPGQVRAYAKFVLQRAKNDRIDAALIAECTALTSTIHAPPDLRLAPFAEHLTMIEQLRADIACDKTRRESCRDPRRRRYWNEEIARLKAVLRSELKALVAAIGQHADLAERLALLTSIDGIGLPTAVGLGGGLPLERSAQGSLQAPDRRRQAAQARADRLRQKTTDLCQYRRPARGSMARQPRCRLAPSRQFLCSTRERPFLRPDLPRRRTPRAAAVKDWPQANRAAAPSVLDDDEHGVILLQVGPI